MGHQTAPANYKQAAKTKGFTPPKPPKPPKPVRPVVLRDASLPIHLDSTIPLLPAYGTPPSCWESNGAPPSRSASSHPCRITWTTLALQNPSVSATVGFNPSPPIARKTRISETKSAPISRVRALIAPRVEKRSAEVYEAQGIADKDKVGTILVFEADAL